MSLFARQSEGIVGGAFWILIGNLTYAASQWGIVLLLSRTVSVEALGQYSLATSICAPIIMFGNMRLRLVIAADAKNEFSFADYFRIRTLTALLSILVVGLIVFYRSDSMEGGLVILIIALAKATESLSDLSYGLFQKESEFKRMGVSLLLKGVFSFVVFSIAIIHTQKLFIAVTSLFLIWSMLFIFYDYPSVRNILKSKSISKCRDKKKNVKMKRLGNKYQNSIALCKYSFILGFVALLGSLMANIPRYFIGDLLGAEQLGFYAALSYIGVVGLLVATSLIQPVLPKLADTYKSGNLVMFYKSVQKMTVIASGMMFVGFVVAWMYGDVLLSLLYGDMFGRYSDVFTLIMLAVGLNYFVLYQWYILTAMGWMKAQLYLSVIALVIVFVLCVFLIPRLGLVGAAIAEITGMLAHVLLGVLLIFRGYKKRFHAFS